LKPVYITGFGITCAIGNNKGEVLHSLKNEIPGIAPVKGVNGLHKPFLGGQVSLSNSELAEFSKTPSISSRSSRSTLLAMAAIGDLLSSTRFSASETSAFLNASSVGGMDTTEKEHLKSGVKDYTQYLHHNVGRMADLICQSHSWPIFRTTISTACSSAANAIMLGGRMINTGKYHSVIAGGSDAMSLFTMRGFESLMIYDSEWCRPFDNNRAGLNLGEAAAYVMLESEESLKESGNQPLAVLAGWANANDAFHQTASSPGGEGAIKSMSEALTIANMVPSDISYINAHGTATPNNDQSESMAIKSLFPQVPPFSSTKSFTGHTLAAAGAVEAAFSVMALEQGLAWANLNFSTPMADPGLVPITTSTEIPEMNSILSNSFGFGGNNSTLILKRIP
jgi:3-oxoacyl-[acyl-carrier-protein] synthase-1